MATSTDSPHGSYTITGGEQGKRRLNLLAEIMQPTKRSALRCRGAHVSA